MASSKKNSLLRNVVIYLCIAGLIIFVSWLIIVCNELEKSVETEEENFMEEVALSEIKTKDSVVDKERWLIGRTTNYLFRIKKTYCDCDDSVILTGQFTKNSNPIYFTLSSQNIDTVLSSIDK